jgi:hypothetical protein
MKTSEGEYEDSSYEGVPSITTDKQLTFKEEMCCILSVCAQTANCDFISRISRTTIPPLIIFKLDVQQNPLQTITVALLVNNFHPFYRTGRFVVSSLQ